MRGLTLRLTNATTSTVEISDFPGVAPLSPGETRELLYVNDVQNSLEYGSINTLLIAGKLTAQFVSGTVLNQAPVGRSFTGASPTTAGERGLVPTAPVASRGNYLKGDGTWSPVTPVTVGAIPQSVLTTQGDTLYRGVTTTERLPLGTLGQSYRAGVVNPEWGSTTLSGTLAAQPSAGPYYQGVFFWATDTSALTVCHYDGTAWVWSPVGGGGGVPGLTRKVIPDPEVVTVPDGCQYLVYDSITFLGTASMVLEGNADLVVLGDPPLTVDAPATVGSLRTLGTSNPQNLGSPSPGSATSASASDHVHQMPNASDVGAVPTTRTVSTTSPLSGGGALSGDLTLSVGTATTLAAGVVQLSSATPQALGTAAAGSTGDASDAGHVHAMPAFPPVYIPLGGYSTVDGTLGTVAIGGSPYNLIDTDYDRTGLTATWEFVLGGSVTNPDVGTVILWDVGAAAAASTITVTSATPATAHSNALVAPAVVTAYELRASVTGGGAGNYVIVNSAAIRVTWA